MLLPAQTHTTHTDYPPPPPHTHTSHNVAPSHVSTSQHLNEFTIRVRSITSDWRPSQ